MKIRNGFVSNSSSSSFAIDLKNLTGTQLDQIQNHIEYAQTLEYRYDADDDDRWSINIDRENQLIEGYTMMDNFDMRMFLEAIGVAASNVRWNCGYY